MDRYLCASRLELSFAMSAKQLRAAPKLVLVSGESPLQGARTLKCQWPIVREITALLWISQTKLAPGSLAILTFPLIVARAPAREPFPLNSVVMAERLAALMPFFSSAALQAAIECGLSELACALVLNNTAHKDATAMR
jgi:hypothetical protein